MNKNIKNSLAQRPVPVSDTGDDDEEPDFEEITLAGNGVPNNGAVLGEVLGKNERVTTDVIDKVCCALNCDVGDMMEIVADEDNTNGGHHDEH